MKDLSLSQEYLLCSLSEKGKLPVFGKEVSVCILASALLEMLMDGCVQLHDKNKVSVMGALSDERPYLRSLYEWLCKPKPVTIEKLAQDYCMTLTDKRLNALIVDIGNSLAESGCVTVENGGVLAFKPRFIPNPDDVEIVIQRIRAELLENGEIADETVALVSLLQKGYQLNRYFSKYESGRLKARLKEIKETPSNQLVKRLVDYVDAIFAVIVITSVTH